MTLPVKLSDVVSVMSLTCDEWTAWINSKTGEIIVLTEDSIRDDDPDIKPPWMVDAEADARKVASSEDFVQLPDKYDIHDYGIMKDFCYTVEDDMLREDLLEAISGRGAFRLFRRMIRQRELEQRWYGFRDAAYDRIAVDFLEAQGISFECA